MTTTQTLPHGMILSKSRAALVCISGTMEAVATGTPTGTEAIGDSYVPSPITQSRNVLISPYINNCHGAVIQGTQNDNTGTSS